MGSPLLRTARLGWPLLSLLLVAPAEAGRKDRTEDVELPPEPEPPPPLVGLFPSVLTGWSPGGLPAGLPSLSAQACNACHYQAHDDWRTSGHAGSGSQAWRAAMEEVGNPACASCHLPLLPQRPETLSFDADDVNRPVLGANPTFDAGLHIEGVTCAACHVRDGAIVGATAHVSAPPVHPAMRWTEELRSSEGCASCHQLTWPGATAPLYDTYGEWQRSAQGQAGIGCADCHFGPGAADGPVRHALDASLARALTIDLSIPTLDVARGGEPLQATVTLSNTGAGHAVPTGSPWRAIAVEIALERPPVDKEKEAVQVGLTTVLLARTLDTEPPWGTTDDTRLGPAERRDIPWTGGLGEDDRTGEWAFVVRLREVVRGVPSAEPAVERRVPLRVD